jgi:hypothetical protein
MPEAINFVDGRRQKYKNKCLQLMNVQVVIHMLVKYLMGEHVMVLLQVVRVTLILPLVHLTMIFKGQSTPLTHHIKLIDSEENFCKL